MFRRVIAGVGSALLIVALFLPWTIFAGANRSGWEFSAIAAALCVVVAACGMTTAITGGRFGFFRPDLPLIAATDLLGTTAMLALGWLVLFDVPQGASRQPGAILALISTAVIAFATADYRPLRGAPLFPRTPAT